MQWSDRPGQKALALRLLTQSRHLVSSDLCKASADDQVPIIDPTIGVLPR
jgi:hypothetical protein